MRLVIDANELFSAIISVGKGRFTKKVDILFSDSVQLCAPDLLFRELENNAAIIKEKAGFFDSDFEVFIQILRLRIKTVPLSESKLKEAKMISPNLKDLPYFAVAFALNCPIWSGDKALKQQSKVQVYNTEELVKEFQL